MDLVTLDFETYYDDEYSLTKLSTDEYVTDSRFEVIGVGIKASNEYAEWHAGPLATDQALQEIDWDNTGVLAHNTMFDGLILQHCYGIIPKFYFDTMLMAKATVYPFSNSVSLKKVAEHLKVGRKGTEVVAAKGKRLTDFTPSELHAYGRYCTNDVELCHKIFKSLGITFPKDEFVAIDTTLRMYLTPLLELDGDKLREELERIRTEKQVLLDNLPGGVTKDDLMSNPKLAEVLKLLGVDPPVKRSPTTGKETWAFAKTDVGFQKLETHPNPAVQAVITARLGHKSTIDETRTERLLEIYQRDRRLRVPLYYYGAHTGRWTGSEGINLQNLPREGHIRHCIRAPEGHSLIVADFKQIEARVNAWLAREYDLLQAFVNREDPYVQFASAIYRKPPDQIDDMERFMGKTCILGLGYGMGHAKFRVTLAQKGISITEDFAKRVVDLYRTRYAAIKKLWQKFDVAIIPHMAKGLSGEFGPLKVIPQACILPNGLTLTYPNLQLTNEGWVYTSRGKFINMYGAKMCENVVQALARIIMVESMNRVTPSYRMVHTVHDELVFCVPDEHIEDATTLISGEMVRQPSWAGGHFNFDIPLEVELGVAKVYGEAK